MYPAKDKLSKLQQFQDSTTQENEVDETRSEALQNIFRSVEVIRQDFDAMKGNINRFGELLDKYQMYPTKELQAQLHSILDASSTVNNTVLNKIKQFEKPAKKNKLTSNEERIKNLQIISLREEFKLLLHENNTIVESYKNTMKAQIKASAKIVRPNQDEEELERLLDSEKPIQIFIDNILEDTNTARQQLKDIEWRHQELLYTEEQLKEILELFKLIAINVEQQQESVNRVEFHCQLASDRVEEGAVDLSKGVKKKQKYRKCKIYALIGIIIIVLILLAIIFGS